jgi:beta-glucanase (GH16 family)
VARTRLKVALVAAAAVTAAAGLLAPTLLTTASADTTAATPAAAAAPDVPAAPAGYQLTWGDDFTGDANTALDTGTWRYDAGLGQYFGTGEIETTTTSTDNVYHDGAGNLVLKALHSGTDPATGWTSGRVETEADAFGAADGGSVMIQASIKQPDITAANGAGYWPAFWMLGSPLRVGVTWPTSGEVDIMENVNARTSAFTTLHCGALAPNPNPCNEFTGIGQDNTCTDCGTKFHTYAVQIDRSTTPEQIRYYLDDTNVFTIKSDQVDATTWANAVHHTFYIIFDLAIGGQFPAAFGGGPTAATVSGGHLDVDYVAVYNKPPAANADLGPNLALGKTTTASSTEKADFDASKATDGDPLTRWSSGPSDPQWLQVDLGQSYPLTHATITWDAAAAKDFELQTSADGTTWETVATKTGGTSDIQDFAFTKTARYVRVNGTTRVSTFGYSLYELAVYGSGSATPTSSASPTDVPTSSASPTAVPTSSASPTAVPTSSVPATDAPTVAPPSSMAPSA